LEFGDKTFAGIIGLDLLQQTESVSFGYGKDAVLLMASQSRESDDNVIEIPFSMAARHIFVDGNIGGTSVALLFDTGARGTIVTREIAAQAGLDLLAGSGREFRGMDGNPIPSELSRPAKLYLNGHPFTAVSFFVADLAVLEGMGLSEDGGILGNDFLLRFELIEVDFKNRLIRLFAE
jgi:hypothetical protein